MPLFTSGRERRLWFWTLAVVAAIYSTLGPARTVVDALRERNLLRLSFAVVVLAVLVFVVAQAVRRRPGWREIGVALGVGLAYWAVFFRMDNPAERTHLIEYGIVAAFIHQALLERERNGRAVPWPAALAVAATAALGLLDEVIQAVLPTRVFDWADVFFNSLAGFMFVVARLALMRVKKPGWRLWFLWFMSAAVGWGWTMDPSVFGEPRVYQLLPFLPTLHVPLYRNIAAGGILVGVFQWLVLRRYLAGAGSWAVASTVAVGATALVHVGLGLVDPDIARLAATAVFGSLAGLLQWLTLRGRVARARWWILASTVGWLVAVAVGDLNGPPGWSIYGAITGSVLVWLLRREATPVRVRGGIT